MRNLAAFKALGRLLMDHGVKSNYRTRTLVGTRMGLRDFPNPTRNRMDKTGNGPRLEVHINCASSTRANGPGAEHSL